MMSGKNLIGGVFLSASLALMAGEASALACAGVESRVNIRTSQLQATIVTHIQTRTAQVVAQEIVERQRLLSALSVMTKQMSDGGSQEIVAHTAAQRAVAQTMVEQSVADQMREAVSTYGNTGFNACGIVAQGHNIAQMAASYRDARATVGDVVEERYNVRSPAQYQSVMSDWTQLAINGDDLTADALWSGDDGQARDFIRLVLGPPRAVMPSGTGDTALRLDRVQALQSLARQSVAATVMADVASSKRLDDALREMAGQWTAGANAEAWAARQAVGGARAALLDTARIEAANVAMAANATKRDYMEEFALAGFALTYVDRMQRENQ